MKNFRLKKVISGGQVGVDQGSLLAAKENYFLTGGYAPLNYRTRNGNQPDILKNIFGLEEMPTKSYSQRTKMNVKESDGTILFCRDFSSAGTNCTKEAIALYQKPLFEILADTDTKGFSSDSEVHNAIIKWLIEKEIKVLNIAGNSLPAGVMFIRSYKFFNGLFLDIRNLQGGDSFGRQRKDHGNIDGDAGMFDLRDCRC